MRIRQWIALTFCGILMFSQLPVNSNALILVKQTGESKTTEISSPDRQAYERLTSLDLVNLDEADLTEELENDCNKLWADIDTILTGEGLLWGRDRREIAVAICEAEVVIEYLRNDLERTIQIAEYIVEQDQIVEWAKERAPDKLVPIYTLRAVSYVNSPKNYDEEMVYTDVVYDDCREALVLARSLDSQSILVRRCMSIAGTFYNQAVIFIEPVIKGYITCESDRLKREDYYNFAHWKLVGGPYRDIEAFHYLMLLEEGFTIEANEGLRKMLDSIEPEDEPEMISKMMLGYGISIYRLRDDLPTSDRAKLALEWISKAVSYCPVSDKEAYLNLLWWKCSCLMSEEDINTFQEAYEIAKNVSENHVYDELTDWQSLSLLGAFRQIYNDYKDFFSGNW